MIDPNSFKDKRILIIGSHVVDELLARDHSVVVLDDLSGGFRENVNAEAVFVHGSVTNVPLAQLYAYIGQPRKQGISSSR